MVAFLDRFSPESPQKKPETPISIPNRRNQCPIAPHSKLSAHHPRSRIFFAILLLQILLVLMFRSNPPPFIRGRQRLASAPSTAVAPGHSIDPCPHGRVYVYDLPAEFNSELVRGCDVLNPWHSLCDVVSNDGLGPPASGTEGLVPASLAPAWYWTDQFVLELLFHNRVANHECRTAEPGSATAFYIPFYAGLAVGKYLWSNFSARECDRHGERLLAWLGDQPYWMRSGGWDHFLTLGRISWDFRRSRDGDWGSSFIYMPGMRNVTRLTIERDWLDDLDVGVPYPTGFHPRSAADVAEWQRHVRERRRTALFSFAGGRRGGGGGRRDFRDLLLSHCLNESDACRAVDCSGTLCGNNGTAGRRILEAFLGADFCLQPRGDSFTRRSMFDCMVAGSIPVFFWKQTAYYQYEWFLPGQPGSYSVFIDLDEVKAGKSVRAVLEGYSREAVRKMREKVIEYIPGLVYARNGESFGGSGLKDAFDVAFQGVLRRFKEQQQQSYISHRQG